MKTRALFLSLIFIINSHISNGQNQINPDTDTYTFRIKLDEKELSFQPCGYILFYKAFRYKVLESNCRFPVSYVVIIHICPSPEIFKNGEVFIVKGKLVCNFAYYNTYQSKEYPVIIGTDFFSAY